MGDPNTLVTQVRSQLIGFLQEVPFVRLTDVEESLGRKDRGVDLELTVLLDDERWRVVVEAKSTGEPRLVRLAVQQLRSVVAGEPGVYAVIAAPYIGPRAAEVCKEASMGYVDLAGNCRLVFSRVFIEYKQFPSPRLERRPLRSLFSPKAGRVLRVLLQDVNKPWQVQSLAREAKVSLGLSSKVKRRLLDLEYAKEEQGGIRLTGPEGLLRQWALAYSYRKNKLLDLFSTGEVSQLESEFVEYCEGSRLNYAFTLFSGAARVVPFTRYSRGFAFALADPERIATDLGWKPVPSGANFTIMRPYDEGLMFGVRSVGGASVVSDVQLYLDLVGYRGRGEEAAEFLLEQRLRPKW